MSSIWLFVCKVISFLVYLFTKIFRRDSSMVVCIGWESKRFADNARYLYLYLSENKNRYSLKRIIWITTDKELYQSLQSNGYDACLKPSILFLYYHLRAKYFVYDQFSKEYHNFLLAGGVVVNLWHGIPIKKFGLWNGLDWTIGDNYLLTCSDLGDRTIGKSFHVLPGHCFHGMYPRNYYLTHPIPFVTKGERLCLDWIERKKIEGKRIIFYLPTFRKNSKVKFFGESDNKKIFNFVNFLEINGYALVTKVHFVGSFQHQDTIGDVSSGVLLNLPSDIDVYPFLKEADLLLSDYSSVIFDYLYLDRDIICLPYDLEEYQTHDQGLLLDYDTLPIEKVTDLEALKVRLTKEQTREIREEMKSQRREWLFKCFEGRSLDETVKSILSL